MCSIYLYSSFWNTWLLHDRQALYSSSFSTSCHVPYTVPSALFTYVCMYFTFRSSHTQSFEPHSSLLNVFCAVEFCSLNQTEETHCCQSSLFCPVKWLVVRMQHRRQRVIDNHVNPLNKHSQSEFPCMLEIRMKEEEEFQTCPSFYKQCIAL